MFVFLSVTGNCLLFSDFKGTDSYMSAYIVTYCFSVCMLFGCSSLFVLLSRCVGKCLCVCVTTAFLSV